jgi:hypothetical protein
VLDADVAVSALAGLFLRHANDLTDGRAALDAVSQA